MKVFVLDKHHNPIMPCKPHRAKKLLQSGKAVVHRQYPFTIRMKHVDASDMKLQPLTLKIDPGTKTTGLTITLPSCDDVGHTTENAVLLSELEHHSDKISKDMSNRAAIRKNRRNRKLRYRAARFLNRTKPSAWLAPSVRARVQTLENWCSKFESLCNIKKIDIEYAKFDTLKLANPNITNEEYQQGTLFGYEIREYLLERDKRKCSYCDATNVPLNIDHWIPQNPRKGEEKGTNRVGNLLLACIKCNQKKGNIPGDKFVKDSKRLKLIQKKMTVKLADATQTNILRKFIYKSLYEKHGGTNVNGWYAYMTKYNRSRLHINKTHSLDALCVGDTHQIKVNKNETVLKIITTGRGNRRMCRTDKYGFPMCHKARAKKNQGYKTGDIAELYVKEGRVIPKGKYVSRITKTDKKFAAFINGRKIAMSIKDMGNILHRADGYNYTFENIATKSVINPIC